MGTPVGVHHVAVRMTFEPPQIAVVVVSKLNHHILPMPLARQSTVLVIVSMTRYGR